MRTSFRFQSFDSLLKKLKEDQTENNTKKLHSVELRLSFLENNFYYSQKSIKFADELYLKQNEYKFIKKALKHINLNKFNEIAIRKYRTYIYTVIELKLS